MNLNPVDFINSVLAQWPYRVALANELRRIKKLRRDGMPGWDGRIKEIECILYGGCKPVSLGQITSGSGFQGQDIAGTSLTQPAAPGQPPILHTVPSPSLSTNQVSISDSPTLISATNRTRDGIVIKNLGTLVVYIGDYNLSVTTGYPLQPNEACTFPTSAPIYGRIASGSANQTVTYVETGKEE